MAEQGSPRSPVSVVIPCFNRERFVAEAIDSALAANVEVAVVDDGSTDGSWDIIVAYGDRVKSARIANAGPARARNVGVGMTSGEFLQFLDSDDVLVPEAMAVMVSEARALPDDAVLLGRTAAIGGVPDSKRTGKLTAAEVLASYVGTTEPFHRRASFLEVGGFDEDLWNNEDHHLAVKLLAKGRTFHRTATVTNRIRPQEHDRLSTSKTALIRQGMALERVTQIVRSSPDPDAILAHSRLLWAVGRDCARAGLAREARVHFEVARELAGRRSENASWPVRTVYRMVEPYRLERAIQSVKKAVRRIV